MKKTCNVINEPVKSDFLRAKGKKVFRTRNLYLNWWHGRYNLMFEDYFMQTLTTITNVDSECGYSLVPESVNWQWKSTVWWRSIRGTNKIAAKFVLAELLIPSTVLNDFEKMQKNRRKISLKWKPLNGAIRRRGQIPNFKYKIWNNIVGKFRLYHQNTE